MCQPDRNVSFATVAGMAELLARGSEVMVRGDRTREILHRVTVLERPLERFVFVPRRRNDPFAQIAEAVWVLAGRDDVAWLARYLPRAADYSDDGEIWRAAYGPRLRRWRGRVDQLNRVRELLLSNPTTRRAVAGLFDPDADFVDSKDVPCNNWLSWVIRNGRLHLAVALRSNDAMWGFSGANAFEWSLVHEALSHWVGAEVGPQTWLASSFHIYERHWERAADIVGAFHGLSPYDCGIVPARFATPFAELERVLGAWFVAEEALSKDPDRPVPALPGPPDPLLSAFLAALRLRWGVPGWPAATLRRELCAMPMSDVTAAVWLQLAQARPELLEAIPHEGLAAYMSAALCPARPPSESLGLTLKRLHSRKDRAYGGAWKRRGELVSVLPNIARKVDRLGAAAGTPPVADDETLLDTAVDLYVYVVKYRLLLEERLPTGLLPPGSPYPASDHDANFDTMIDREDLVCPGGDVGAAIGTVISTFEELWRAASTDGRLDEIMRLVDELRAGSRDLVVAAAAADAGGVAALARTEEKLALERRL